MVFDQRVLYLLLLSLRVVSSTLHVIIIDVITRAHRLIHHKLTCEKKFSEFDVILTVHRR